MIARFERLMPHHPAPPANRVVEIAGPEALGVDEAVRRYLAAAGDSRSVITDADAPNYGVKVG